MVENEVKCTILALKTSAVANIWQIVEDYSETSVGINFIISEKEQAGRDVCGIGSQRPAAAESLLGQWQNVDF